MDIRGEGRGEEAVLCELHIMSKGKDTIWYPSFYFFKYLFFPQLLLSLSRTPTLYLSTIIIDHRLQFIIAGGVYCSIATVLYYLVYSID